MKTSTIAIYSFIIFGIVIGGFYACNHTVDPQTVPIPKSEKPVEPVTHNLPESNPQPVSLIGKSFNFNKTVDGDFPALPQTKLCKSGILVDLDTHDVLWMKDGQTAVPIASMTKMMTALLVFEAIEKRSDFTFDTIIKVTNEAAKVGGSEVWLDPRESFSVHELMEAMMIKSANDCAYLLAQHLGGGSTKPFIQQMNQRALELGMKKTRFLNSNGLPESNPIGENMASPLDMIILAEALLQYPKAIEYAKTIRSSFGPKRKTSVELLNHNRALLEGCNGCDGLKTGFTQKARFCVTATCLRNGRRLAVVVCGAATGNRLKDARTQAAMALFDWGFKQIDSKP